MRIAVLQMRSGIDPARNLADMENAVQAAASGGAVMLFTPEMSGILDRDQQRSSVHLHLEEDDPTLSALQRSAAEHRVWIHVGSLALKSKQVAGKRVNCGFVIDDLGLIRARYEKIHLFDVALSTGEAWRESAVYAPGARAVVTATPLGQLGLSICYDIRFPALYAALSGAGATLLSVPAAFTVPTGSAHWHVLLRARAIENACFVIAAAQCGQHDDGRATYGHSLVVDPWGRVVLDMEDAVGLGFADLALADVDDVRRRVPVLAHRRVIDTVEVCP